MAGLPPPPVAMAAPVHIPINNVRGLLVTCGVNDQDIYQNQTPAQRMAAEMFADDLETFMEVSNQEISDNLKAYGELSVAQGRLRFAVGVCNICLLYTSPSPRDS